MNVLEKIKSKIFAGIILGFLVMIGFALFADLRKLQAVLVEFQWRYLGLAIVFTAVNYLLRFVKWGMYLRELNISLALRESLVVFLSGLTMSITPAKIGEVLKSFLLEKLKGIPISRTAPIVVTERITDLIGMVLLASFGATIFAYGRQLLVGTFLLLALFILVVQSRKTSLTILEFLGKLPLVNRFAGSIRTAYESTFLMLRFPILLKAIAISFLSWFFECWALYMVFKGFFVDQSLVSSMFIFSFSSIAGAVSMVPGGLGVAEGSMTGLMLMQGVPKAVAVAATLIIRFGTLWFGVLIGVSTLMWNLKKFGGAAEEARQNSVEVSS
ncbi:lysylphosphatidylglycerol synthase transmembrane domain-containing protein [Calderihabitans maritimus]|uniref:Phosphatidylglycerol lysyltransferase n=1 Tax=Calderihabitans maritimus TaxID=1246530 RepID=A0A1Z5HWT0_9FIRM|nr:lysylphosphatidylglycerol synthase transmembrane domain-containing protein [Calderihabitans maritimus]GAW93993.1 hypothetical protein Metev_1245 [Calderihabitans maritimus]